MLAYTFFYLAIWSFSSFPTAYNKFLKSVSVSLSPSQTRRAVSILDRANFHSRSPLAALAYL